MRRLYHVQLVVDCELRSCSWRRVADRVLERVSKRARDIVGTSVTRAAHASRWLFPWR
jgi:hypothetical protein